MMIWENKPERKVDCWGCGEKILKGESCVRLYMERSSGENYHKKYAEKQFMEWLTEIRNMKI